MKLVYPAVLEPWENESGFTVIVPDLPGCVTEGDTLADAISMAQDAASGWVLDELQDGKPVPKATAIRDISLEGDSFATLLLLDIDNYTAKH